MFRAHGCIPCTVMGKESMVKRASMMKEGSLRLRHGSMVMGPECCSSVGSGSGGTTERHRRGGACGGMLSVEC
ncbi:hypothetical protein [Rubritalea tangerina]|uniref:hypothetical protein n=1 Tax=Rubritalea tangerina TaxID=430798 RepID=UPI00360E0201